MSKLTNEEIKLWKSQRYTACADLIIKRLYNNDASKLSEALDYAISWDRKQGELRNKLLRN